MLKYIYSMYIVVLATHSYYIGPNIQFILSIFYQLVSVCAYFLIFEIDIVHGATCNNLYSKVSAVPRCSLQDVRSKFFGINSVIVFMWADILYYISTALFFLQTDVGAGSNTH